MTIFIKKKPNKSDKQTNIEKKGVAEHKILQKKISEQKFDLLEHKKLKN